MDRAAHTASRTSHQPQAQRRARSWVVAGAVVLATNAHAQTISMNFDDVSGESSQPQCGFSLGSYFLAHNVWVIGYSGGTYFCVVKASGIGGVACASPTSGRYYFVHFRDEANPRTATLTLVFSQPVSSFTLTRPPLQAGESKPARYPAWTLSAHTADGELIDSSSHPRVVSVSNVPALTSSVSGCNITQVRITAAHDTTMTVPGMVIDDMSMTLQTCGSADYNGDGDFGTDQDIEAFFACIAGDCCPTCTQDFDADCDHATTADIEAFFRVLSGGPC